MTSKYFLALILFSPLCLYSSLFDKKQESLDQAALKRKVSELRQLILEEKRKLPSESIIDTAAEITHLKKRVQSHKNFSTRVAHLYPELPMYLCFLAGTISGMIVFDLLERS